MKHLRTFEELDPSTYRNIKDRTGDYAWSEYAASTPDRKEKARQMGRINKLSGERFEKEFYNQFPTETTKIKVYDSLDPSKKVELMFNELQFRANWTYYDLDFKQIDSPFYRGNYNTHIRFHGDSETPYTLERGERVGFKGEILVDDKSIELLKSMFNFGKDIIETEKEIETPIEPDKKGFVTKVKDWFNSK